MRNLTYSALAMVAAAVLGACASVPRGGGGAGGGVPEDFWLSVTVMNPSDDARLGLCQRPVKFLIESDRLLRATTGAGVSEYSNTTLLRPLSAEQVRAVYDAFEKSGVNAKGVSVSAAPEREDLGERCLLVVSSRQDGRRRTVVIDQSQGVDAGGCGLVEVLCRLAWRE